MSGSQQSVWRTSVAKLRSESDPARERINAKTLIRCRYPLDMGTKGHMSRIFQAGRVTWKSCAIEPRVTRVRTLDSYFASHSAPARPLLHAFGDVLNDISHRIIYVNSIGFRLGVRSLACSRRSPLGMPSRSSWASASFHYAGAVATSKQD
jgi:hypothetical protein